MILGWTDKTLAIVAEIAEANASDGGGTVVLLATDDKETMEERYQAHGFLDVCCGAFDLRMP